MAIKINGTNTTANPGITGPDTDTGLVYGTDQVQVGTGGTTRATVDSSGNLGVGTSAPVAGLTVAKQGTILSGTGNSFGFSINPQSNGYVYLDAVTSSSFNTSLSLRTYNNGTYTQVIQSISGNNTTFETAGSERMRLDSSGNVGINITPSGSSKLQLNGSMRFAGSGTASDSTNPIIYRVSGADSLAFASGNSERLRIQSGGGISFNGDTAAANALDDYEEGTWTPLDSNGNSWAVNKTPTYTKIGRVVYLAFDISAGNSVNGAVIKGLPFNAMNSPGGNFVFNNGYASGADARTVGHTGSDNIVLYVGQTNEQLTNGQRVIMGGFYFTS